eukprot:Clim_evm51s151 gene=Clim_evmTU51s151
MSDLPQGWVKKESRSRPGVFYYFNTEDGTSSWEKPANEQVRAAHLLVKHSGSRRPASWKSEKITRSEEEAREILRGYQTRIAAGETTLEELATTESDCSSANRGGDLGWFGRGQMQKPFEDAAFGLQVGETSDIISTESGVHIVKRTG